MTKTRELKGFSELFFLIGERGQISFVIFRIDVFSFHQIRLERISMEYLLTDTDRVEIHELRSRYVSILGRNGLFHHSAGQWLKLAMWS